MILEPIKIFLKKLICCTFDPKEVMTGTQFEKNYCLYERLWKKITFILEVKSEIDLLGISGASRTMQFRNSKKYILDESNIL